MRTRLLALAMAVLAGTAAFGQENRSSTNRSESLKFICQRLGIGSGAVIADVGCGDGPDTMVFASIVGPGGTVLAQEIDTAKLKKVQETADKRGFHQVVPILGQSDDPRLPNGFADLIYMNKVFHHFSRPQNMLRQLWLDLKPGGALAIVDQQKGPLTDWAPMEEREKKHHWTGETTVVRLAREAGFLFHGVWNDLWYEKQPFLLVFRKPVESKQPESDPDLPQRLDANAVIRVLPLAQADGNAVAFFGLDRGREVVPMLKAKLPSSARLYDVMIDEWALSREELPSEAQESKGEILRTTKGDLILPADVQLGLVVFADAYHRLWDPLPILRRLKQHMTGSALIAVIDREGPDSEIRRLAGHRRRISSKVVIEEMRQAGFRLRESQPAPARDRLFLLFGIDSDSP
ncbi:MAG: methyltransferase domain-containing protein [Verrucomicrobia bacterium]|nr:methyltransferase domain-containing protein [Verrucomicrobiota bacterium]